MANNGGVRLCQDCRRPLHAGHSRVCPGPPQAPARGGGAGGQNQPRVDALLARVVELERGLVTLRGQRSTSRVVGSSVEDMRVAASGQPRGSVNRVFTLHLGFLNAGNTTGVQFVNMPRAEGVVGGTDPTFLDVSSTMPGFTDWASGYGDVSISSVALVYLPTCAGVVGSSFVTLGFGRADRSLATAAAANTLERGVTTGWPETTQLRTVYEANTAFDRHLLGGRQNRQVRPWGRIYAVRSSTAFIQAGGTGSSYTGSLGILRLYVQCACIREQV